MLNSDARDHCIQHAISRRQEKKEKRQFQESSEYTS